MKYDEQRAKEEIDRINQIPIIDMAQTMGFTLTRVGKYISLKEHDSVRIDPKANFFWRNSMEGVQGGIINFMMHFQNLTKANAIKELKQIGNISPSLSNLWQSLPEVKKVNDKKPIRLILPEKASHNKNVAAYLIKTRCIDNKIVSDLLHSHNLYQDTHNNCVFVSYDNNGKESFCNVRGTNTYKRYVRDIEGCDYTSGFYLDNQSKTLVVSESVIDALSLATIDVQHGRDYKRNNYLAISGTKKTEAIYNHLKKDSNIETLVLAFDADFAGLEALQKVHKHLEKANWKGKVIDYQPEQAKDWNEVLQIKEKDKALTEYKEQFISDKQLKQNKSNRQLLCR